MFVSFGVLFPCKMSVLTIVGLIISLFNTNVVTYIIKTDSSHTLIQYLEELRQFRPLVLFIDLDETVVAKETCISYDYPSTQYYLQLFEDQCSHLDDSFMPLFRQSLEKRYYESPSVLLDRPLAAYLLSLANNNSPKFNVSIIAITSNQWPEHRSHGNNRSQCSNHVFTLLHLLRSTAARRGCDRWFHPLFENKSMITLPYSKAVGVQVEGVGMIFFKGLTQETDSAINKGHIILEIQRLYLSRPFGDYSFYHMVLVDDTRSKLTDALTTILLRDNRDNNGLLVQPMTKLKSSSNSGKSRWYVRNTHSNYSTPTTTGLALIHFGRAQQMAEQQTEDGKPSASSVSSPSPSFSFSCAAAEIREILSLLSLSSSARKSLTTDNRERAIACAFKLLPP